MDAETRKRVKRALAMAIVLFLLFAVFTAFDNLQDNGNTENGTTITSPLEYRWNTSSIIATMQQIVNSEKTETVFSLDNPTGAEYSALAIDPAATATSPNNAPKWDAQYAYTNAEPSTESNELFKPFTPRDATQPASFSRIIISPNAANAPQPILVILPGSAPNAEQTDLLKDALEPIQRTSLDAGQAATASRIASIILDRYATERNTAERLTEDNTITDFSPELLESMRQYALTLAAIAPALQTEGNAIDVTNALEGFEAIVKTSGSTTEVAQLSPGYRLLLERFQTASTRRTADQARESFRELIDIFSNDQSSAADNFFKAAARLRQIEAEQTTPTPNNPSGTTNPQQATSNKYYEPDVFPEFSTYETTITVSELEPTNSIELIMTSPVELSEPLAKFESVEEYPLTRYASLRVETIGKTIKTRINIDVSGEILENGVLPFDDVNGNLVVGFFEIPSVIQQDLNAKTPEEKQTRNRVKLTIHLNHVNLAVLGARYGLTIGEDPITVRAMLAAIEQASRCNPLTPVLDPDITLSNGQFVCPLNGKIISGWGPRGNAGGKISKFHKGLDLTAKVGTPIHAAADGLVERAGVLDPGCGNGVKINHGRDENGDLFQTAYCHLSRIDVTAGTQIKAGQIVGLSGGSLSQPAETRGHSTGPHLHWGLFVNYAAQPLEKYYANCVGASSLPPASASMCKYDGPLSYNEVLPFNSNGCFDLKAYPATSASDLRGKPSISVQTIQTVLTQARSPAAEEQGFAKCLYDEGVKAGIDPAFPLGFFAMESTYGKYGIAKHTKGIGNIRYTGPKEGVTGNYKGFRVYATYCDSAKDWYNLIKQGGPYFRDGRYKLEEIVPKYAPASDGNYPAGYIRTVQALVTKWRAQEGNFASTAAQFGGHGTSATGQSIISTASTYIGKLRYVYGGESLTEGADCSGFTQSIYKQSNINIPRTANTQYHSGTPVDKNALQPGDLLFFGSNDYASHVGIYSGPCIMVHSPKPGRTVSTENFCGNPYLPPYLGARRYATGQGSGKTIVLDAGHGIGNPLEGASGSYNGKTYAEADVVLDITLKTGKILEANGYKIKYTRTDEYAPASGDASYTTRLSNKPGSDAYVSIHANGNGEGGHATGLELYYWDARTTNTLTATDQAFAKAVYNKLLPAIGNGNGVLRHPEQLHFWNPYNGVNIPTILVETAYMDNAHDMAILATDAGRQNIANALAAGITGYLGGADPNPCTNELGTWKTHIITTEFGCGSNTQITASGLSTSAKEYYAALPTRKALNHEIEVRGPNGKTLRLPVIDVGPFCTTDNNYVLGSARPLAEIYQGKIIPAENCNKNIAANGAGLDVSCQAARELGINGKGYADWRFVT